MTPPTSPARPRQLEKRHTPFSPPFGKSKPKKIILQTPEPPTRTRSADSKDALKSAAAAKLTATRGAPPPEAPRGLTSAPYEPPRPLVPSPPRPSRSSPPSQSPVPGPSRSSPQSQSPVPAPPAPARPTQRFHDPTVTTTAASGARFSDPIVTSAAANRSKLWDPAAAAKASPGTRFQPLRRPFGVSKPTPDRVPLPVFDGPFRRPLSLQAEPLPAASRFALPEPLAHRPARTRPTPVPGGNFRDALDFVTNTGRALARQERFGSSANTVAARGPVVRQPNYLFDCNYQQGLPTGPVLPPIPYDRFRDALAYVLSRPPRSPGPSASRLSIAPTSSRIDRPARVRSLDHRATTDQPGASFRQPLSLPRVPRTRNQLDVSYHPPRGRFLDVPPRSPRPQRLRRAPVRLTDNYLFNYSSPSSHSSSSSSSLSRSRFLPPFSSTPLDCAAYTTPPSADYRPFDSID